MPAIRLADIPNAPSGFNASGININAPRQARLGSISLAPIGLASQGIQVGSPNLGSVGIEAPEYAQLGQNANADPNALIGAARQMQQESLDPSDFNASAKVMEGMAKSIQLAGQFADNWTDKFLEAKNSSDIAKAETFLRSVYEKQSADQIGKPPEKWEEIWKENLETARKGLSEIKASPSAHEAMQMTFQRWQDISTFDIARKARVEQVNGMKMDMTANALMKAANGDYEGAIMTMRDSVKKGIHSEQEASLFGARLQDNIVRKAKEQQREKITSEILTDPYRAKEILTKAKNGEVTEFGDLDPSRVKLHLYEADRQIRAMDSENWNSLVEKIQNGDIASKDQLKQEADGMKIDPAKYKRLENAIAATISFDPKVAGDLKAKVAGFDFSADKNDANFYELKSEIVSRLPKDHAQLLTEELNSAWKKSLDGTPKSPREVYRSDFIQGIKRLGDSGLLGETGLDKDGKTIVDQSKNNEYNARVYSVMQGMDEWFNNPANKDKTPADAQSHRDMLIEPLLDEKARSNWMKKGPTSFQPSTGFQTRMMDRMDKPAEPPAPSVEREQKAREKAKEAKAEGKVTSYNFSGDPYSDSNSRNLIGAWNNKLTKDSLAISPDIERKFKAAGIGKGDAVELTLADGSTVIRNWDDRTMQDEEATRKFGKPLRGRFDFHSPDGKQAKDGMAVVSFRKATNA